MNNQKLQDLLSNEGGRKHIIEKWISKDNEENWQNVFTPWDICREMCDIIPDDATHYAVLFNMEFIEVLVKERNVDPKNIIYFPDNSVEAGMAAEIYGVNVGGVLSKKEIVGDGKFNKDLLNKILQEGLESMKFDKLAVVMNPPYQSLDYGGKKQSGSAIPIYNHFIETAIDHLLPSYLVSINPSRWMIGGKGRHLATLDKFRERMVLSQKIRNIVHFPGDREVFPNVSIIGGISYFLWDNNYNGTCCFTTRGVSTYRDLNEFDLVIQDNSAVGILRKIMNKNCNWLTDKVFSRKPFGLSTNFEEWIEKSSDDSDGTACYSSHGQYHVSKKSYQDKHQIVDKWKVVTSKANGAAQNENKNGARHVLTNVFIIAPEEVCTETYIVINVFDTKSEADNFVHYVQTKFFRFMLGLRVATQNFSKQKFAWVPDVEDYSRPWTDEELYDKFGLTRQEREYIESKIRPFKEKLQIPKANRSSEPKHVNVQLDFSKNNNDAPKNKTKTEAVGLYLADNPYAGPKEIAEALGKKGIDITANYAAVIKSNLKKKQKNG